MNKLAITPSLASYIETRDKKLVSAGHWQSTPLKSDFLELLTHGKIKVGGRASCGSSDLSWKQLTAWKQIVRKANKLGYSIIETPVKVEQRYATIAGGFWQESVYTIGS